MDTVYFDAVKDKKYLKCDADTDVLAEAPWDYDEGYVLCGHSGMRSSSVLDMRRKDTRTARELLDEYGQPSEAVAFINGRLGASGTEKMNAFFKSKGMKPDNVLNIIDYYCADDDNAAFSVIRQPGVLDSGQIILSPVYASGHSGVSFSLGSFGDKWDSGCAGFAWITKDGCARAGRKFSRETLEKDFSCFRNYAEGSVYAVSVSEWDELHEEWGEKTWAGNVYPGNDGRLDIRQCVADCFGYKGLRELSEKKASELFFRPQPSRSGHRLDFRSGKDSASKEMKGDIER
jgi:hypothetical protein